MSENTTHATIEAIARNSYGQLIAYIAARSGDVVEAEDALSEAFVAALDRWPVDGVPEKPEAWLLHVARNRIIDAARHHQVRRKSEEFVPLDQQDPSLWSRPLMDEAEDHLRTAAGFRRMGRYQLEAAIQSIHAHRAQNGLIDWPEILLLYEGLVKISPGVGALVGRAVALAQAGQAPAGLAALEEMGTNRTSNYQPYWAARGHILQLLNCEDEARKAFTRAASLTDDPALRDYLFSRAAE